MKLSIRQRDCLLVAIEQAMRAYCDCPLCSAPASYISPVCGQTRVHAGEVHAAVCAELDGARTGKAVRR